MNEIISNLLKIGIGRSELIKAGFSAQKYDDVKRNKSTYKISEIIKISNTFDISLDYILTGKSPETICLSEPETICLSENEEELLNIFRQFSDREQIKVIGQVENILSQYRQTNEPKENVG